MNYIFDSSFLIALIFEEDVLHEKSWLDLEEALKGDYNFYINENIYMESLTVSCYKGGLSKVGILKNFIEESGFILINESFENYIDFFVNLGTKISVQDSSIIYDYKIYGGKVLSYDKQLLNILKIY